MAEFAVVAVDDNISPVVCSADGERRNARTGAAHPHALRRPRARTVRCSVEGLLDYGKSAERPMAMSDRVWRRHANPCSRTTRLATAPFPFLAI